MASNQSIAQTPQDASASSAPFVIHIDAPDYKNDNNSAPQRIILTTAEATDAKTLKENPEADAGEDAPGAWEIDFCGCFGSCCTAFYASCLPCFAANDAAVRIGRSGSLVAVAMGLFYVGWVALAVLFKYQMKSELYVEHDYTSYYTRTYYYHFSPEPKYGLLLGALACALAYCLVLAKVRNMVRHFYRIPSSWASDVASAICFPCCTVAQLSRHTELAEAKKKTEEEAATLPAYSEA